MVAEVIERRLAQRQTEASLSNIRTLDNFNDVAARYQEFPGAEIINASLPLGDVVNAVIEKIHALNEK
jgi:thymidylate kinase